MILLIYMIISGIIVSIISAFIGALIQKKIIHEKNFPSKTKIVKNDKSYQHLNGVWHQYHLSYDTSISDNHFWTHHIENFSISKENIVTGKSVNKFHPLTELSYNMLGEIENGRMIIKAQNINDPTDFGTMIYPNLLSNNIIIGLMTGFDFQCRMYITPLILSQNELNLSKLNIILKSLKYKGISIPPTKKAYLT